MENYKYKARTQQGKLVSGVATAEDEVGLQTKLNEENLFLVQAKVIKKKRNAKRIKSKQLASFAGDLGRLVESGVSLVRALKIISEDESIKPQHQKIYAELLRQVRSGKPLSEAFMEQGEVFPALFVNMIKSAEASGHLDRTALQMADYYDKQYKLDQKVKSAMTYPKILGCLLIGVLSIIMGYVMPQFESMFAQMDTLPMATTILLGISDFFVAKWYLLIFGVVVAILGYNILMAVPVVRLLVDRMKLKAPVFGKLNRVIYSARFSRTLASLYSAGIPIVTSLQIAKDTIGNTYLESQFDQVLSTVRSGGNLSEAIDHVDGFVKKLPSSIFVGEETGQLDNMLMSIANQLDYDSEIAIGRMVAMLEPAMIVVMAVVVGFVMISVIQPIYQSYSTIGSN